MTRLKLTKAGFTNFTGRLLGADFVDGIADDISQSTCDTIAAAIGGDLIDGAGDVIGPAGSHYRRTILPKGYLVDEEGQDPEDQEPGDEEPDDEEPGDEEPGDEEPGDENVEE